MVTQTVAPPTQAVAKIRIKCTCGKLFTTHNIYKNHIDIVICLSCGNQFKTHLLVEHTYNNGRQLILTHHALTTRHFFIKPHRPAEDEPDHCDVGEQLCPGDTVILNRNTYQVHHAVLAYYGNDITQPLQEIVLVPVTQEADNG